MADGGDPLSFRKEVIPGPDTIRDLRDVLGQFATGVTVVTVQTDTGPMGMTANSFSSVSMDPPLVLWCPAKASSRFVHFEKAPHFAIHVLDASQSNRALQFARAGDDFAGITISRNAQGVPLLEHCLARFECSTHAIHDAGDHAIMVGRILKASMIKNDPLLFCRGQFGEFSGT